MTVNEQIYDIAVRHAIYLLRQREGLVDLIESAVTANDAAFIKKIRAALAKLSQKDLERIGSTGAYSTQNAKQVRDLIRQHGIDSAKVAQVALKPEIEGLMQNEAQYWQSRLGGVLPTAAGLALVLPAASALRKRYSGHIVGSLGETPREMLAGWASRRVQGLFRGLRDSAASGTVSTITVNLRRINRLGLRGLGGNVRSLHNHATEQSKQALNDENDLINDLVWVSVLDSRTSDICFSRNGMLINKELNGQTPPAHINCRSTTILGVKSWRQLDLKGLPKGARNELDGRLVGADSESTETWFKRQSAKTQKEILGPTRFDAFNDGGLRFPNDFINRSEDRWTLDELKRRDPAAFNDN